MKNFRNFAKTTGLSTTLCFKKGDIGKILRSTLTSRGLFFKTRDDKWFYHEQESYNYVIREVEKYVTKNLSKTNAVSESSKKR